jgi:hypothetical protein
VFAGLDDGRSINVSRAIPLNRDLPANAALAPLNATACKYGKVEK